VFISSLPSKRRESLGLLKYQVLPNQSLPHYLLHLFHKRMWF